MPKPKQPYPQYQLLQDQTFGPFSFKAGDTLTIGRSQTGNSYTKADGTPYSAKNGEQMKSNLKDWYLFQIPNKPNRWYTLLTGILANGEVFRRVGQNSLI